MKLVLALLLQVASCVALFSCKDQQNKDVDWFAAYKMPKRKDNSAAGIGSGHGFYYLDVNNKKFAPSQFSLNDTNQAVAFTLQQFYDAKSDPELFYVLYNDEEIEVDPSPDPLLNVLKDSVKMQFGHTKGVLFFNKQGGVWIIHSVPRFPPSDRYSYPVSGTNYGQSMLCVTYNYDQLAKIGTHLFFTHPNMWLSALPIDIAAENVDLAQVIAGQFSRGAPFYLRTELISRDGRKFSAFGKNGDFNQDLYDGLVAWSLQTPLEVETWRRGSLVPLNCTSPYPVVDCQNMQIGMTEAFKYTHDHSKIAVSTNPLKPFVCIGDINRMTTQFIRGGGTVCFSDTFVWEAYVKLTVNTNSC